MSEVPEQNKALHRRFFDAWNARDMDAFDAIFSVESVVHDPYTSLSGVIHGAEEMKKTIAIYHGAFSDGRFEISDQIAEGDLVVTRWTAKGVNDGEKDGRPPTGNYVEVEGVTVSRCSEGKLAESWMYLDSLGLTLQLGALAELA